MSDVVLWRRLIAEFLGSAFLAAIVIGSGVAAQQLSPGNTGLQLLENAAATAAGLFAIILMFGPVSGGHFNPVVSFVDAVFGGISWRDAGAYLPAQVAGCALGAVVANVMFSRAAFELSTTHRASPAHFLSEIVATLGLLLVIFALARSGRSASAPAAVGAYIGAAYFFTSSTSFANPAITVGRMFSNSFAGIAPSSAPSFIGAQVSGGILAVVLIKVLYPTITSRQAGDILFPHVPESTPKTAADAGTN
jgi:glycerol uptake facilitator-like aquaporin